MLRAHSSPSMENAGTRPYMAMPRATRDVTASVEEVQCLAKRGRQLRLPTRRVLFSKGDLADGLYFLMRGHVKVSTASAQGKELVLAILGPGDMIGELALLDRTQQTATATALEPCDVLWVARYDIMVALDQYPKSLLPLLSAMTKRLRAATNLVEDLAFLKLPSRLAKTLISLGYLCGRETGHGLRLDYRVTQQDLANMVGTTRESINKVLADWKTRGLLSFARGFLNIPQPEALLRAAL